MSKHHHRRKRSSKCSKARSPFYSSDYDDLEEYDQTKEPLFEIKKSKNIGRYMVAKVHLNPGTIILKENPLVVGPCVGSKVQCIGCYKEIENNLNEYRCISCEWPICSTNCTGQYTKFGHTKFECSLLKECNSINFFDWNDMENIRINYHSLVPLRCLLLKSADPDAYQTLRDMESHNEIRKNIPEVWKRNQMTVVDKILKEWKLTEFTEDEIHTICGILEVNAFEIGHEGVNIRGVYPTAFLMSHDCIPNTNHSDDGSDNFTLTVRASTNIPLGYPITLSYVYTLQNTIRRREHLLENKFFDCYCRRCMDPTELGTCLGAFICPKCKIGTVLSSDPLNNNADWYCTNKKSCQGYILPSSSINVLNQRMTQEYERIDCNDIVSLEQFLEKYANVLHPNHYLFLGVKLYLSQLYGKIDGYIIHNMSDELLIRKITICKDILKIFDILEPGLTKLRGVTLYELHAPLMVLLTRQFEKGVLTKEEIKLRLKEVVKCLVDARNILNFEPVISPEGKMGVAAKEALIQIKDWEKITGRI